MGFVDQVRLLKWVKVLAKYCKARNSSGMILEPIQPSGHQSKEEIGYIQRERVAPL